MSKSSTSDELLRDQAIEALAAMGITKIDGDGRNDPPLIKSIRDGNKILLRILLRAGCNVNATDVMPEKCSALNLAIIREESEIATMLLQAGANTEVKDCAGTTPLMVAVFFGLTEIAKELLERGTNTSAQSNSGETALIIAAKSKRFVEAEMILRKSCESIDFCTNRGSTALMFAAARRDQRMVRLFLRSGCNVDLVSNLGHTASTVAADQGQTEIVSLIAAHKRVSELCVQAEKSPTEKLFDVMASLQTSATSTLKITNTAPQKNEVKAMSRLIVESEVGVNVATAVGWRPLHFAARFGEVADVLALIARGADVNAMANGAEGEISVLNCAVRSGNTGVVNCILKQEDLGFSALINGLKAAIKFGNSWSAIFKEPRVITGFLELSEKEKNDFCAELRSAASAASSKNIAGIKKEIKGLEDKGRTVQKKSHPKKTAQQPIKKTPESVSEASSAIDEAVAESLEGVDLEFEKDPSFNSSFAKYFAAEQTSAQELEDDDEWERDCKWLGSRPSISSPDPIPNGAEESEKVIAAVNTSLNLTASIADFPLRDLGLNPAAKVFVPNGFQKPTPAVSSSSISVLAGGKTSVAAK